jgi:hypothetical protein
MGPHLSDTQVDHVIDAVLSFRPANQSETRRRQFRLA